MEKYNDDNIRYNNKYNNYSYNQKSNYYQNQNSNKLTHFVNIPITDEKFISNYEKHFITQLMENPPFNENSYYAHLIQKKGKLHITVCVLNLDSTEKIENVKKALDELTLSLEFKEFIQKSTFDCKISKFESMQENYDKTRVIYADFEENEDLNSIKKLIDLIIKHLINKQLIDENDLNKSHIVYDKKSSMYLNTIHLTLLNILFMNKIEKKQGYYPSRSIYKTKEILSYLNKENDKGELIQSLSLGSVGFKEFHFSVMRENKITEMYDCVSAYSLKSNQSLKNN